MDNPMLGKQLFEAEHIELSAVNPEKDAGVFADWTRDPIFHRKLFHKALQPKPESEAKKKLQEILKEADDKHDGIYFAVRKIGAPEMVGLIWFPWIDAQHQTSSMGVKFGSDDDFDSFAAEALKLALYYAFMELSLHRVVVNARGDEPKWLDLIEESGFLREVQRRENIYSQGRYVDEYLYALLKSEWKQKQSEVIQ